jgi:hypothetical protein
MRRTTEPYYKGAHAFLDYAIRYFRRLRNIGEEVKDDAIVMPCPCKTCVNRLQFTAKVVRIHLFEHGFCEDYTKWYRHGEMNEPSTSSAPIHVEATTEVGDDNPDFASEKPTDGPPTIEMLRGTNDYFDDPDNVNFQKLLLDAEEALYPGCPDFTKVSAILELLNLKGKHGCSDVFFTELLLLLKRMLPKPNGLVENTYEAKKIVKLMGSGYQKIHACVNNCIIYYKQDENKTVCRSCGITRWKVDEKTKKVYENVPAKVMWCFPIIPRLQRLFKIESMSEDLRWHATRKITEGILRHPADSQAWRTIDEMFPEIAKDPRNLRLGISADGVDVNRGNRQHSVWPVLTLIYNLPPWLCMKRKFIMLAVLISGYPGKDIDVFLEPLVDDLKLLFEEGVNTYDAYTKDYFNLRAVVLWTINDYPALGALCGCPTSGYKGCAVCGTETKSIRLKASSKQSFVGHRRYLPYGHAFRNQTKAFNGDVERGTAPTPKTGEEIYNEVQQIQNTWGKVNGKDVRGRGGKIIKGNKKKKHKRIRVLQKK